MVCKSKNVFLHFFVPSFSLLVCLFWDLLKLVKSLNVYEMHGEKNRPEVEHFVEPSRDRKQWDRWTGRGHPKVPGQEVPKYSVKLRTFINSGSSAFQASQLLTNLHSTLIHWPLSRFLLPPASHHYDFTVLPERYKDVESDLILTKGKKKNLILDTTFALKERFNSLGTRWTPKSQELFFSTRAFSQLPTISEIKGWVGLEWNGLLQNSHEKRIHVNSPVLKQQMKGIHSEEVLVL